MNKCDFDFYVGGARSVSGKRRTSTSKYIQYYFKYKYIIKSDDVVVRFITNKYYLS